MKKGDILIGLIAIIIMALLGLGYKLYLNSLGSERYVNIYVDEELYRSVKLTKDVDVKIDVESKYGHNVVHIHDNGIEVIEADCPNQDDVRQGFVKMPGISIICVPNRMRVVIEGETNTDDATSK